MFIIYSLQHVYKLYIYTCIYRNTCICAYICICLYTCKNIHAYVRKPTDPRGMIVALLYMPSIKLSIRSPVCSKSWSLNGEKQRKARRIGLNRGMDVCLFTLPLVGHDTQLNLINMYIYIYIIVSIFAIHVYTMYIYNIIFYICLLQLRVGNWNGFSFKHNSSIKPFTNHSDKAFPARRCTSVLSRTR